MIGARRAIEASNFEECIAPNKLENVPLVGAGVWTSLFSDCEFLSHYVRQALTEAFARDLDLICLVLEA